MTYTPTPNDYNYCGISYDQIDDRILTLTDRLGLF